MAVSPTWKALARPKGLKRDLGRSGGLVTTGKSQVQDPVHTCLAAGIASDASDNDWADRGNFEVLMLFRGARLSLLPIPHF